MILHHSFRVFGRKCTPPPGLGASFWGQEFPAPHHFQPGLQQLSAVGMCWVLCMEWVLEIRQRWEFNSKDVCASPSSSCSGGKWLWQAGCYLPVSAGKVSSDDSSSNCLHFYAVFPCCFPLGSSYTVGMFISSRKGAGVTIPAFCHSLSLQGASVSAGRALREWPGSGDSRLCPQKSTLFLQVWGRWKEISWMVLLPPEENKWEGKLRCSLNALIEQHKLQPLGSAGCHNTFVSQGRMSYLTLLLFFKEDFSEHPVIPLRILVCWFLFPWLCVCETWQWISQSVLTFLLFLRPEMQSELSVQPGGALSPHPNGAGAWNSERKQPAYKEAFPNTPLLHCWGQAFLAWSHSKSMKRNNFLKDNWFVLKHVYCLNASSCSQSGIACYTHHSVVVQPNLELSSSLSCLANQWALILVKSGLMLRGGCTLGVLLQLRPQLWLTFQLWKLYSASFICHLMSWVLPQGCLWLELSAGINFLTGFEV